MRLNPIERRAVRWVLVAAGLVLVAYTARAHGEHHGVPPQPAVWQGDDTLTFEFGAPRDGLAYRYRLDGYDGGWIEAAGARRAVYTNLPAGPYNFFVQANGSGGWYEAGVPVRLHVAAPRKGGMGTLLGYGVLAFMGGVPFLWWRRVRTATSNRWMPERDRVEGASTPAAFTPAPNPHLETRAPRLGPRTAEGEAGIYPYDTTGLGLSGGDGAPVTEEAIALMETAATVLVVGATAEIYDCIRLHLAPAYHVVEVAWEWEGVERAQEDRPELSVPGRDRVAHDGIALRLTQRSPSPQLLLTDCAEDVDRAAARISKTLDGRGLGALVDELGTLSQRLRRSEFAPVPTVSAPPSHPPPLGGEPHMEPAEVESADDAFLRRVRAVLEAHLSDDGFSVADLAQEIGMSRGHLHRQLKELAGETPSGALRAMRLERAAQLLTARAGTVSEVAYAVGFKSVSHFSNGFEERYGCRPSVYPEASAAQQTMPQPIDRYISTD